MALFDYMLRLGTELVGSNMDLTPLPTEDTDGDGTDGTDGEGTEDGDGEGTDGEGTDGEGTDGEGTDGEDGKGTDGEGTDGEDGEGEGADGKGTDGEGTDGEGTDGEGIDNGSDDADPGAIGAGSLAESGGHCDLGADPKAYLDLLAVLEANIGLGLLDNNEAMAAAVIGERDDECRDGEKVWRPFDPSLDMIHRPTNHYADAAARYRADGRLLTAGIRSQFRAKFLMAKTKKVIHGTRRGTDLSERRLVDSYIEIKSGIRPTRPYFQNVKEDNVSIAIAVVGDQSGSMAGPRRQAAATAMTAIAEAFDSLGSPIMCCGPRNGARPSRSVRDEYMEGCNKYGESPGFHRLRGTRIDLFKDWDEPFRVCKDHFGAYTATGGTPLSDGIQFSMQELSQREERYRVILVLTDGVPNHSGVVKRQIRLAAEAGIFIIGVGFGSDGDSVASLFPLHVVVPTLDTLAKRMMETVSAIVFPKFAKKAVLDGRVTAKVC